MKPEKALELVGRYARLTKAIKRCKPRIGECLDKCPGLKGFRLEKATEACDWMFIRVGDPTKAAQDDQDTHLSIWYERVKDDEGRVSYGEVDEDECPHCYAAHLIVQERKELRHQLAAVKGAMTRSVS